MKSSVLRCCRHCVASSLVIFLTLCLSASLFAVQSSQQASTSRGPQIYIQASQAIKVNHTGSSLAVQALAAGNAQPLSSTSADVDEDGVSDLLAGYSTPAGGVVVLHRGNLDAFAPQSNQSFLAIARSEFPTPFLPDAQVFNVPVRPDFIATGHFVGSGHLDLVIASRGGNALYVFAGDGKGKFTNPQVIQLPGGVTALAAGNLGKSGPFSTLIIGLSNKQNSSVAVYRGGVNGLTQLASYKLTSPVSGIALGDLDGDRHPDAAVLSGGQVQILHSAPMKLESLSLPVSAVSMALGSFIHDRGLRLQIALLAADGSIHIAAPGSFDSRAFTQDEAKAMRLASLLRQPNPVVPMQAPAFNEAWNVVESFSAVAPFGGSGATPVLLRARISSHATDDVMVFNPAASQMAVISHANVQAGATSFAPGTVSVRSYNGSPVAAVSARVNVDGRPGVVLLHEGQVGPFVMMPLPDPTFMVNTTADTVTANGCAPANPNTCSLREAVIEANASAGSDTIMVPAGTYQLTIAPAAGADPHDATTGDLDITDAVSIVGANSATTIIEAGTSAGAGIDKIFSINPLGAGAGFDTSISNLTLRFGTNPFAAGTGDQFGGALDWSAGFDGAGNLTITSCVITDNATTDGDGGGLSLSNPGGSGIATISNSTIQNNIANTATTGNGGVGGGILAGSFTSVTLTNSQLLNNQAPQATGAKGKGGAMNLGAFSHSNIHGTTISGNQAAGDGGGIWTNQGLTIDQGTVITSNTAGGNGGGIWSDNQDVDVTSLSKLTITGNSATGNGGGIHVDINSPQVVHLNFSRIVNNTAAAGTGVDNVNGTIDATDSWWGCNQGPSTAPCDTINDPNLGVTFDPFIVLTHTANPAAIAVGNTTTLTASFLQDNHGTAIAVGNLSALVGLPIQFNNPILGTLSNQQTSIQSSGTATATYTATTAGAGHADAVVDNATVTANITNVGPPSIAKAFGLPNILLGGSTALTFTITNSNAVALTGVAFTDSLPSGLVVATPNGGPGSCGGGVVTAIAGSGTVSLTGGTVPASGSCLIALNVTGTSLGNKVNTTGAVTSANGGTGNTATASVVVLPRPILTITKTHVGNFSPGQVGATYTITVSNAGGAGATVGSVTVVDALPAGLTATNIAGTGWICTLSILNCSRADVLNAGASYPPITLTVNVANNVGATVTNTVTVFGGGELNTASASDPTHTGSAALQITENGGNLTVTAGSTTSATFTVDAASGLGTITFSCSGLPAGAACSFNPPSENQVTATVTMTVSTTAGSAALHPFGGNSNTPIYAVLLPILGLAGVTLRGKKGKAARLRLAFLLAGAMMLFSLVSCGGRGSNQVGGTPAGTFPFSVTATSGAASASTTVNLTVLSPGPQH